MSWWDDEFSKGKIFKWQVLKSNQALSQNKKEKKNNKKI